MLEKVPLIVGRAQFTARGHGPHRHAFEIFALDTRTQFAGAPGRDALIKALRGHVLAKGVLIGTGERRAEARDPTGF